MRLRRVRSRTVTVVFAAAVLLQGCGDEASAPDSAATAESLTDTHPVDEDSPSTSSGDDPGSESPTNALDEILITLDDLGDGWAPNEAQGEGNTAGCDGRDPIGDANPLEEARSDFGHGETGPHVVSRAWRFASTDEATTFLDAYVDAMEACDGYTDSDEYEDITYRIEPFEFGAVGDRSHAIHLNADASFGEIAYETVVFQVDDLVVEVVNGGFAMAASPLAPAGEFTEVDSAFTRSLVEIVASRT